MPARSSIDSKRVRDPELGQQVLHEIARRPVRLDECEHMIALFAQRQRGGGDGRDAGAHQQAVVPALQLRQRELELAQGRDSRCASNRTPHARRASSAASRRRRRRRT